VNEKADMVGTSEYGIHIFTTNSVSFPGRHIDIAVPVNSPVQHAAHVYSRNTTPCRFPRSTVLGHKVNLIVISRVKVVLADEDLSLAELVHVKSNPAFSSALCYSDGYININHLVACASYERRSATP
jgi:hypothetical protein